MRVIERARQPIDLAAYKQRSASEDDYDELVCEPFALVENGQVQMVYLELGDDPIFSDELDQIYTACRRIRYIEDARTDGLKTQSRIFGFMPRNTIRKDFCSATKLAQDQPREHHVVADLGARIVSHYYRTHNPELFEKHRALATERVREEYRLEHEHAFTWGIVNKNNPLKYHFDSGNFKGVWSGMLAFKHQIGGGHLCFPEYGIAAEIKDRSLFFFDGQGILHGVTPIQRLADDALRFTIVYYSLAQMWNCEPLSDEVLRIRAKRTAYEAKRAATKK